MKQRHKQQFTDTFEPSGFFVMRTPLLPFDAMLQWSAAGCTSDSKAADRRANNGSDPAPQRLVSHLRQRLDSELVREAIFLASPSLADRLEQWRSGSLNGETTGLERAFARYFARMAGRATPFGLFAACSFGSLGRNTRIEVSGVQAVTRTTHLDMGYLTRLSDSLVRDARVRPRLQFHPNSTLLHTGGSLRYFEGRDDPQEGRDYHLVSVQASEPLLATLHRAVHGARPEELAKALSNDDIALDEASMFIDELIDAQVLIPELEPRVTGPDPTSQFVRTLRQNVVDESLLKPIESVRLRLAELDHNAERNTIEDYQQIADQLEVLPAPVDKGRLFQVDSYRPLRDACLGEEVVSEIKCGIRILAKLANKGNSEINIFRRQFLDRYGDREVPLLEALDEESGIPLGGSDKLESGSSPLLDGLQFPTRLYSDTHEWGPWQHWLSQRLYRAWTEGEWQIELKESDVDNATGAEPAPLPDAFHAMGTLAAQSQEDLDRGNFLFQFNGFGGPSGARLLGRFCHLNDELLEAVKSHLHAEEAHRPEAIFAEITHLSEGRDGNLIRRPVLRNFEIPFLGASGTPVENQIPLEDLLVSVQDERFVLRSRRLGKEVLPRMSTAHNFMWRKLAVYRFLGLLQSQDCLGGGGWSWGPFATAPRLPRVCFGRLILARAQWNIALDELDPLLGKNGSVPRQTAEEWGEARGLPRFFALAEGDNELVVDLENTVSFDAFLDVARKQPKFTLVELFPTPEMMVTKGPEGRFVHELIVPFVKKALPTKPRLTVEPRQSVRIQRTFPLGTEWLYVKLYSGEATADQLLCDSVGPLTQQFFDSGSDNDWFFIRYADPDPHLRLRFRGNPQALREIFLPDFQRAVAKKLSTGRIWRIQFDTYEREVERYGGDHGIELAERIFQFDSTAVVEILNSLNGDQGQKSRWRLALIGIDLLLNDLGLNMKEKQAVIKTMRESFGREFQVDRSFLQQLSIRFRQERKSLTDLIECFEGVDETEWKGIQALRRRSKGIRPLVAELRHREQSHLLTDPMTVLARSYVHMFVNRLIRSSQRAHELVLYDFLDRLYRSQTARSQPQTKSRLTRAS